MDRGVTSASWYRHAAGPHSAASVRKTPRFFPGQSWWAIPKDKAVCRARTVARQTHGCQSASPMGLTGDCRLVSPGARRRPGPQAWAARITPSGSPSEPLPRQSRQPARRAVMSAARCAAERHARQAGSGVCVSGQSGQPLDLKRGVERFDARAGFDADEYRHVAHPDIEPERNRRPNPFRPDDQHATHRTAPCRFLAGWPDDPVRPPAGRPVARLCRACVLPPFPSG